MINTGPKGQYVHKGPARRAITFKSDRPEGPIPSKAIGPKGQYVQKRRARRAKTFRGDRPKGPLRSERAIR